MLSIIPKTLVEKLEGNFEGYSISKMSPRDKQFLWETVKRIQPTRCLEIGVYTGGSSAIILEAIKDTKDAILFANDICPTHPFLKDRKPGFIIEEKFPELSSKYHTFIGKDISEYIEDIGGQFDLALIDTAHYHPCECLNLITILPFMKENSWVVLHDIGQFYCRQDKFDGHNCYATKYIWDAWVGEKISSEKCEYFTLPNIGAIKVGNVKENKRKLISLLFNKWDMEITEEVIVAVRKIIEKYYDKADLEYFDLIIKRKEEIKKGLNRGSNMQTSIEKIKKYGPFEKRTNENGRRRIYFCGVKVLSYKKSQKSTQAGLNSTHKIHYESCVTSTANHSSTQSHFKDMSKVNKGVLYIVFGKNYIKEAIISAESVKQHNPTLHITLMCDDENITSNFIDDIKLIKAEHIRAKIDYVYKTPYDETIFLDSDTIIDHDISEMFDILEKYEFAIAHDLARKRENIALEIPEYSEIPYMFSEVNPGVMVFKDNQNVQRFFQIWREYFYKYKEICPWEQPTFRVALWKADMNLYIFPPEYNVRGIATREKQDINHHLYGEEHLKPRIYHYHANENIRDGVFDRISVKECLDFLKKHCLHVQ